MSDLKTKFLPVAAYGFLRMLGATWRIRTSNPHNSPTPDSNRNQGIIFVFWHNKILAHTYHYRHCAITAMVSKSRDGEYIARTAGLLGHDSVRGSTSRNSRSALTAALKVLRAGRNIAVTPDGPQGPRYVLQAGVIELARITQSPIVPMSYTASPKIVFKSWDQFILPLAWAKIEIRFGAAIRVPAQLSDLEFEDQRRKVEKALLDLGDQ